MYNSKKGTMSTRETILTRRLQLTGLRMPPELEPALGEDHGTTMRRLDALADYIDSTAEEAAFSQAAEPPSHQLHWWEMETEEFNPIYWHQRYQPATYQKVSFAVTPLIPVPSGHSGEEHHVI